MQIFIVDEATGGKSNERQDKRTSKTRKWQGSMQMQQIDQCLLCEYDFRPSNLLSVHCDKHTANHCENSAPKLLLCQKGQSS